VIDISVCLCTFRRPEPLLRLLRSLRHLDPATPRYEVIVVDNDARATAEPAIRQARAEGLQLQYLVEPVRSIARARNRSLEPASGEYVAFIDDDEEAEPQWLVQLWGEVIRHGADGGLGPVLPKFSTGTPRWLIEGGFFERARFPTGTVLEAKRTRTGNALVRRRSLIALSGPFDERYDLTGGEDGDLFARMIDSGCRFIAVDSAIVYEHLSPARTTVSWLLRRGFLAGMDAARLYKATLRGRPRRFQRTRPLALALAWGIAGALLFPLFRGYGTARLSLAARQLGRFAFHSGFSYRPYLEDSWR